VELLTEKKQEWVDQFKPDAVMRGKTLEPNIKAQYQYQRSIDKLINQMQRECLREIVKLFRSPTGKEYFAQDNTISSQARIITNKLQNKFDQLFAENAKAISETMVLKENTTSAVHLKQSLKELSGGMNISTDLITPDMKDILKASIAESTELIKSIPQQYMVGFQGDVMRSITTGNGLKDLVPQIKYRKGVTDRRAKNIALDQTRKAYNALNRGRMEALGIDTYEWVHSGGGKEPRPEHKQRYPAGLNGGIFSLNDPPVIQKATGGKPAIRGKPGDLINCRCTMRPVIKFTKGKRDNE